MENKYKTLFFISLLIVIILLSFLLYNNVQKKIIISNEQDRLSQNLETLIPSTPNSFWLENEIARDDFLLILDENYETEIRDGTCGDEFDKRPHYENPVSTSSWEGQPPYPIRKCFIDFVSVSHSLEAIQIGCECYYATKIN